jgi:hypothetical protein
MDTLDIPTWLDVGFTEPLQHNSLNQDSTINALSHCHVKTLDRFEVMFERLLEALAEGTSLVDYVEEYYSADIANTTGTPITPGQYRKWIYADKERIKRFEDAMELFSLALADQNVRISDGKNPDGTMSMNDTARSTLQVKTRKDYMVAFNKKRFGTDQPFTPSGFGAGGITINLGNVKSPYVIENDVVIANE